MRRRLAFWALGALAFALVVIDLAAWGWPASRFLHGDYIQYWLASRALLEGWNPYDPITWRAMHNAIGSAGYEIAPGFGFLYPLTTAAATLPFALVSVTFAAPLWFVTQSTSLFVALTSLGRRIFATHPRRDLIVLLFFAVVMEPAYVLAGDGNLTRFLPAIIGGALALILRGKAVSGGLVLGLGVLKPQLLIVFVPALLLFLSWRERIRVVFGAALTVGVLLAVSLLGRPTWINEWIREVTAVQGAYGRTNLWGYVATDQRIIGVGIAAALVLALVLWWFVRRPPVLVAASVALALSLFLSPYGAPYDQALLLIPVATYLAMIEDTGGIRRLIFVVLLLGTSTALAWPSWLGISDPGLELEIPAPAIAILLVLLDFLVRAPVRRRRAVPAGAS